MECKFVIGQKVVCINDDIKAGRIPGKKYADSTLDGLTKGEIYTVRNIYTCETSKSGICIELEEIVRPMNIPGVNCKPGYDHIRFAPLKEKTSDISVFTEILNKVNDGNHDNDYDFCLDELFETVHVGTFEEIVEKINDEK
jgi:hypothetical protein